MGGRNDPAYLTANYNKSPNLKVQMPTQRPAHGRKLINFCNYTLNNEDIINNKSLADDKIYSPYIKEQVFNYNNESEIKEELNNHIKFTKQLQSIHSGHGSFNITPNPGSKKPLFRG